MTPRYSIVIPTHNRSSLLRSALKSAVHQDFDDYEIVVSDDNSADNTLEVVEEIGSDRVRYVRPPSRMSMADHFEWALGQTTGEYVTILCDDDAVSPDLLRRVEEVICETGTRVLALNSALYWHPDIQEQGAANSLTGRLFSGKALECSSRAVLQAMFKRMQWGGTPRANNSFCRRDVIDRIRERAGRFFFSPAADISSCCLVLAMVDRYVLLDEPLHLFGVSIESIGNDQSKNRSEKSLDFAESLREELFRLSPLKVYCVSNIYAESLLRVRELLPDEFPELDSLALYVTCRRDLNRLRRNKVQVKRDFLELEAFRRTLGWRAVTRLWRALAKDTVLTLPLVGLLRSMKHLLVPPQIGINHNAKAVHIRGDDAGFANIFQCAQSLPALRQRLCVNGSADPLEEEPIRG